MRELLAACGPVKEWKPVMDVDSGRMKGFGFCSFEDGMGALTALQVLNGLKVDTQELALKPNKVWLEMGRKAERISWSWKER